jgi:hypothetical protein
MRASKTKTIPEAPKLTQEEAKAKIRTLSTKRAYYWSHGLPVPSEIEMKLAQIRALLNDLNDTTENI